MMNPDDQKIIALYQQTREQQPTPAMDDSILAAARQRVSQKPKTSKRVIWALSSAAVLVLSVNVALKLVVDPSTTQAPLTPLSSEQEDTFATYDSAIEQPETPRAPLVKKSFIPKQALKKRALKQKLETEIIRQKTQASKQRSMMPRMMQAPMAQDVLTSSIMAEESLAYQLPYFPFSIKQLLVKYSPLDIKQSTANEIQITKDKALILNINKSSQKLIISAYPNSESLGVRVDWTLKPSQLRECVTLKSETQCKLSPSQTAYFKNNQLIKVTWFQYASNQH